MTDPHLPLWPADESSSFRRSEVSRRIGAGDALWDRASRDVLRWTVKTRSGFDVPDAEPVTPGARLTITARVLGIAVHEPIRVVSVVVTASRVGFAYRTLPGHPVTGEEAFIVHREGEDVFLTVRSLTRPAPQQPWRSLHPLLRIAQRVARRGYLRALR